MKRFLLLPYITLLSVTGTVSGFTSPALAGPPEVDQEMVEQICGRAYESWEDNIPKRYRTKADCVRDWKANFAKAGDYTGRWSTDIKRCQQFERFEEGFAEITKKRAIFFESDCKITRVRDGVYGKALVFRVNMTCDAEGETIKQTRIFDVDSAGMLHDSDANPKSNDGQTYYRCN